MTKGCGANAASRSIRTRNQAILNTLKGRLLGLFNPL